MGLEKLDLKNLFGVKGRATQIPRNSEKNYSSEFLRM